MAIYDVDDYLDEWEVGEIALELDDQEPQVTWPHVPGEQPVGPDQDVDLARREPPHRLTLVGLRAEA